MSDWAGCTCVIPGTGADYWRLDPACTVHGFPLGTRVTYHDEDPANPVFVGVIVEPTAEEIAHAATYSDPVGPDAGDVLVHWDEDEPWDRAWNRPDDLIRLPEETS